MEEQKNKKFEDYDWSSLLREGTLKKLKVSELDKYLHHYKLCNSLKLKKTPLILLQYYSTIPMQLQHHLKKIQSQMIPQWNPVTVTRTLSLLIHLRQILMQIPQPVNLIPTASTVNLMLNQCLQQQGVEDCNKLKSERFCK